MYISVRTTIHFFRMGFCHVHPFMNDSPFPCVWVFVMHISLRMTTISFEWVFVMYMFLWMTIHLLVYGFSSCTFQYEWLCISFEWVFIMYMFVWMTIHFLVYGFLSCTFLYEWLPFLFEMNFRHTHFCLNYYHFFLNKFSSCTFLYEWLPFRFEWIVVMYISVRMTTISFSTDFRHAHFCTNDYHFFLNGFS